jgi:hypothetical protein
MGARIAPNSTIRMAAKVAAVGILVSTTSLAGSMDQGGAGVVRDDRVVAPRGPLPTEGSSLGDAARGDAADRRAREKQRTTAAFRSTATQHARINAASSESDDCNQACRDDLARARTATEPYWEVNDARADGFVELPGCNSSPQGTAGIQYVNPGRFSNHAVAVEQPESLLYMPEGFSWHQRHDAGRRLVAAEYSVLILDRAQEPPVLFGQRFRGPFPSTVPGFQQYRLRVWLYSSNPDGVFADANPLEACVASGLVAPHAYEQNLHEVFGVFSVDPEVARDVLEIPDELRIRVNELSGKTVVWVGGRSSEWSGIDDGAATSTALAAAFVPLQAPDWTGESSFSAFPTAGYPFSFVVDRHDYVEWWRSQTGVGSDVIRYASSLSFHFQPTVSETGPGYRFNSADFVLDATVTDPLPLDVTNSFRFWHESPRGMALVREWIEGGRGMMLPPGAVTVTPTPGTPLAELLADCNPGRTAGSCAADHGFVVTTNLGARFASTASVSREWWNPRATFGAG